MGKAVKYGEGDCFGVPLPDGGYAIGVIARASSNRGKGILLGYFFGPRRTALPSLEQLAPLTVKDATYVCRFGDLGLSNGTWPVLGHLPGWSRVQWPMPFFVREQLVSGITFKVVYADDDPARVVSEKEVSAAAAAGYAKDGLLGAQAVALVLSKTLPTLQ
jgi:hypothetical protein